MTLNDWAAVIIGIGIPIVLFIFLTFFAKTLFQEEDDYDI